MKNRAVLALSLFAVFIAVANFFPTHAQKMVARTQTGAGNGAPPLSNPLEVALLKWYKGNTVPITFPVGSQPYGIAFDGQNIWVASFGGTITELRANDGAVLGSFSTGVEPYGVTFDGANIWVSNVASGNVTKLRASDGKNLGTFSIGPNPGWMAFDGGTFGCLMATTWWRRSVPLTARL